MKNNWNVVYYETIKKECPIENFINSKSIKNRAKILNWLEQLKLRGRTCRDRTRICLKTEFMS